jgi:hypothetical protein
MPTIPRKLTVTNVSSDVINAILNEGWSINYRDYVPITASDADSIRNIGKIIMDAPNLRNAFATDLINRIILVVVTSKMYENPWARLKKGKLELGEVVEEIFVNIAKAELYNPAAAKDTVFRRRIPDIRAAFHVLNYQVKYPVTIGNEELSMAFTTENGLYNLIEKIYETLYTADAYDEFNIMKYLVAEHILAGHIKTVSIPAPNTEANVRADVTAIKATSNKMKFMTGDYNIAGVKTHAKHEEQTVIVSADFDAAMDVQVLAAAFNMDKAEFLSKRLLVDSFGSIDVIRLAECAPELCENIVYDDNGYVVSASLKNISADDLTALDAIPAVIIDDAWMQIYDRLITMEDIRNPDGLYTNAFLHCWKIISVSPYAPAATFVTGSASVSAVTITPSAANTVKGGNINFSAAVTGSGFYDRTVAWSLVGTYKDGTTIDASGNLHVASDETAQTITVKATSNADSTVSATATGTVYDNLTVYNGQVVVPNP